MEGVSLLHEIHLEPWGQRTIRFFDPDGHLVEIGEKFEIFIKRMYDENMNIEQIAAKTFVPIYLIKEIVGGC